MSDLLAPYLQHLEARIRARQHQDLARLPPELAAFCSSQPAQCLQLVIRALEAVTTPQLVQAIGEELLDNLLNESSAAIHAEVSDQLRTNRKFRQAFACATYASVDPAIVSEWVEIFQELGTTKKAERKSLWAAPSKT